MLTTVTGYWLEVIAYSFVLIEFTTDPFPRGTNVYANIALSDILTYFIDPPLGPKFAAIGYIEWWTYYREDGTESDPQIGSGFNQNAVAVNNCARIKFGLNGIQVSTTAQVNIFTY
jgi:hypothetical protein